MNFKKQELIDMAFEELYNIVSLCRKHYAECDDAYICEKRGMAQAYCKLAKVDYMELFYKVVKQYDIDMEKEGY